MKMFGRSESKLSFLRSFCNKFLVGELLTPPSPTTVKSPKRANLEKITVVKLAS